MLRSRALRLMIYDTTCRGADGRLPLSHAWQAGEGLYRGLGRIDAACGAESWEEALDFLATHRLGEAVGEVQFWGHGRWGCALIDGQRLDAGALRAGHRLRGRLEAVRERMDAGGLWWFRTCETLGAEAGHDLARRWSDFFGGRVAGHTFVIGAWQSGLHSLAAGEVPGWSTSEGLAAGTPSAPERALGAAPWRPRTISFLHGRIPAGW
ncbi:MAG: hypothetical protein ACI8S6_002925 [Myxococcota bacterium]|jgi:hypothetical protein